MVRYQMSQGKKKTTVIFCTLQNTVEGPGCLIPPRRAAAVVHPLSLHGPLFWETLHSRHNRLAWDRPAQDTDRSSRLFDLHGRRQRRGSNSEIFIPKWVSDI